ncbi:GNAT family N-acetyltransferase [Pseudomonas sp. FW305-17]|nr:GNAT family N-acetyltransferase [Pseudomonas sp. FW305-42]PNA24049.1 GNAT family N-acetyltransferase [Pseudomonas sp. MPR-R1B]PNB24703.1 GNAT family N-acetyltransferase [Pseudomonas sp. DP16D-E2]PNB42122.1 GNAT family N-acetyltransferase [Pseudomonas sp. FW305-17]PNB58802.1 GNAT family N-acetyltransferase [Pseudomonas sp. GW531-E2]PNB65666.1 GNAT family N-acetyltransferase [Pseudomonas sp. FW305-127]
MECHIRRAQRDDAQAISRIVIAALHESNSQDYPAEVITQVEQSFSPTAVSALLDSRVVFVAFNQSELLGTASLDGEVVRTVFVAPIHHGEGIGRQLMKAIHTAAIRTGVSALRVPSSITAQGFYARLGYRKLRDEFHGVERTIVMEKSTLTISEAAHALNVSCEYLAKQLDEGAIPHTCVDGERGITLPDLIAYKDRHDAISQT